MGRLRIGRWWTTLGAGATLAVGCQGVDQQYEPPHREVVEIYPGVPTPSKGVTAVAARTTRTDTVAANATVPAASPPDRVRTVSALEQPDPQPPMVVVRPESSIPQAVPVPEETLDLGIALRLAGVGNPTINLAREQVREALAGQLAARSLLLPSVNIGGNFHLHRGVLQGSPGYIRTVDSQDMYLGFGARTLAGETVGFPGIRLFAHLGDAIYEPLAARQRVSARRSDAQAVQNAILLDVSTAYLELVGAEARLAILRQAGTDLAEIVRLTGVYAKTGQGRPADAKRAETHADLLLREVRQGEEEVAVASARLCRLLNLDPSVRLRSPGGPVEPVRLIPEVADAEELIAEALRARPEVFASSAEIGEAQTRVKQERVRPWLPLISAGYSAGVFGGGSNLVSSEFGPLKGRTDFDVFAVWTVQNLGFGNRALVRRANAAFGQAISAYDVVVNQIRREVAEALADARAAARQIDVAKRSVADAEEGFRLEAARIRQGFGRPLEALDTFQQLLDARQELLRALVAFDIAQFRLFVAIGSNPLATGLACQQ